MTSGRLNISPSSDRWETIDLTDTVIKTYSLEEWAKNFSLMTAGYRDQLDPNDYGNPSVALNVVTYAILAEARARVLKIDHKGDKPIHLHVGGETRPHTQEFIQILSRVYASHGFQVHLRSRVKTTPIWYSSFGVFYNGFQGGDNVTASHSPFFKGGWKPLDANGKQLLQEEGLIIKEVQNIVTSQSTITLAPWHSSGLIYHDFDVDEAYAAYQKPLIEKHFGEVLKANDKGFRCAISPLGGSMKGTSERIFNLLGISTGPNGIVNYFYGEEDSRYHNIGQIGDENYGVDPTKKEIYKNVGAQKKLLDREADIVFMWDPDGDRFNMVTVAPASIGEKAKEYLEVESFPEHGKLIVYFSSNQIFLMLTALRLDSLMKSGDLENYNWFIAASVTSTKSLDEIAAAYSIPVARVNVGFKYPGTFAEWIETRTDPQESCPINLIALREKVYIGDKPRALIMCEESGGAILGNIHYIQNRSHDQNLIALREKDGMQISLLAMALAAKLYNEDSSIVQYYIDTIEKYQIKYRYFARKDVSLYDESLTGKERNMAKEEGNEKKKKIMRFFAGLMSETPTKIKDVLNAGVPEGPQLFPEPKRVCPIGDGSYLEFDDFTCIVRESGTDALIRYYIDGNDRKRNDRILQFLINLKL
ncbi:MAG: hypothetical protein NT096_10580 [Proteobacteria bacterium]|nr:hypothetical protein [Pseudomonadota bacterium]